MKKTVVTILLVLPFVLMFVISFMAKIMSTYQYIYVDKVCFAQDNKCINDPNYYITLGLEEEYSLEIIVYPELASNKKVSYSSLRKDIADVDQTGKVKALKYGITPITVETEDGKKTSTVIIKVSDEAVSGVDIQEETIDISVKEEYSLTATILPETALNRKVKWTSSDTNIATVDLNGKVKGITQGQVTITAISDDGGYIDTCIVNVKNFSEPFDLKSTGLTLDEETYDISQLIEIYDENLNIHDFIYKIIEGDEYCSMNGSVITIQSGHLIKISIEVPQVSYKPILLVYRR